jgi:hypothetical protein
MSRKTARRQRAIEDVLAGAAVLANGVLLLVPDGLPAGGAAGLELPARLEVWRVAAGLSKVQASRVFDVPVLTWYRWVGGTNPTPAHTAQLCRVLDAAAAVRSLPRQNLSVARPGVKTVGL